MASRAEAAPVEGAELPRSPAPPTLRHAVRVSITDAYFHSWRLLPANVVWSVVAIVIAAMAAISPLAVVLLPVLALPTAGLFRVATRIVRGEPVSFWDAVDAWRTGVRQSLVVGTAIGGGGLVLASNVAIGLTSASPVGWGFATLAGWGLVALALVAWTVWPILLDPLRDDRSAKDRLRLAGLLVLAHPFRIGGLALGLTAFLVASAASIVALVTISLALSALVASRFILPAADRLEAELAARAGHPIVPAAGGSTRVSSAE